MWYGTPKKVTFVTLEQVNPAIFRDYDIRGKSEADLSPALAYRLGRAFAAQLGPAARTVCVGGDMRLDTPELKAELARGLAVSGLEVIDIGQVPTPAVYFAVCHLGTDAGVQVTASHNPPCDNGFKFCGRDAAPVVAAEIAALREAVCAPEPPPAETVGRIRSQSIDEVYLDAIASRVEIGRPLKVVVDAGNGMLAELGPRLLRKLGMQVSEMYCTIDGRFPNHPADPTVAANMAELMERVRSEGADLGLGYDGDGDRIGAVDERGRLLYGDQLLALLARPILAERKGAPIVFEVKCSRALVQDIEQHGGRPVMFRTGHSNIKARMHADEAPLGGEMSGHMFFADDWFGFDDALFASARLLAQLSNGEASLGALLDTLPSYPCTPEIRVPCADERKFEVVASLARHFGERYPCLTVDGVRFDVGQGWGLVRASNTSPKLIVRAEAEDDDGLAAIKAELREALSELAGLSVPALD